MSQERRKKKGRRRKKKRTTEEEKKDDGGRKKEKKRKRKKGRRKGREPDSGVTGTVNNSKCEQTDRCLAGQFRRKESIGTHPTVLPCSSGSGVTQRKTAGMLR